MGESRNAYRVLVGRPEGKRPLGRPRRRWEDNIKMDLREVGYDDRDWINLAQDRDRWRAYVRAAMNLRFRIILIGLQQKQKQESSVKRLGANPQTIKENTENLLEESEDIGLEVNPEKTKFQDRKLPNILLVIGRGKPRNKSEPDQLTDRPLEIEISETTAGSDLTNSAVPASSAAAETVIAHSDSTTSVMSLSSEIEGIFNTSITLRFSVPVTPKPSTSSARESNLRDEQRLRVFENKVLRKIFRAQRDEITGEWRKLHNIKLHALYSSPDIIRNIKSRRLRWAGHVAHMVKSINVYRVLVGRQEGKTSFGRPKRRWEDSIKMDLREVGYDGRDWINLAQDRD
ncbi:hypothetical protein ANN_23294 [Periplaneta americana]|uniref:Uncharacterized protein n=1 Tax=Periplaneta americana TaxID=6978 RepID=A0ABQ8SKR5_PERAM|nr:hypothetical protein ANN_23294 [Periplaneta americana]